MSQTFSEAQLFHAYEVVFQTLLNGLIVAVAVLLIAAIVLITLCCRQLKAQTRRRDPELKDANEESLGNCDNESIRKREARGGSGRGQEEHGL